MLAALFLLADYTAALDLSDRTDVRPRTTQLVQAPPTTAGTPPADQTPVIGVDLFTQPRAFLHVNDHRWDYTLTYAPSITAPDVETGFSPQVIHIADASVAWHDRFWRVTLNEDASYGQLNSAYLLPAQTPAGQLPTIQAAPVPTTFEYGFTHTYGTITLRATRRLALSVGAEYVVSGGVDATSQAVLPLEYGPRFTAGADYTLTRRDHLVTAAFAQRTDFDLGPCVILPGQTLAANAQCAPQADIVQAEELWRHAISRTTSFAAGAGAAFTRDRTVPTVPFDSQVLPVGDLSLSQTLDRAGSALVLSARYAPYVDIRTGNVVDAAQGYASLTEILTHVVTLRTNLGASQGFPTSNPVAASIATGEVGADFHVVRRRPVEVDLSVGERGIWQAEAAVGTFVSVFGYFAVTVREPTLHF